MFERPVFMAFKVGKFRDVFARRPVGRAIDVPNERSKRRALGFVVEQKKWFWSAVTCVSVLLSAVIMIAIVPGDFGRGIAVTLAAALAGGLCQSIRLFRKTQIKRNRTQTETGARILQHQAELYTFIGLQADTEPVCLLVIGEFREY